MPTKEDLRQFQALPLPLKILMTKNRIREWVREFGTSGVYVGFSGGKDSTVLLHIVREMYPDIEAVFVNTGLEYPEIQRFVKTFDNVTILRPKMRFDEVIKKYGYPIISKEVSNTISGARRNIKDKKYSLRLCKLGVNIDDYGGLTNNSGCDYQKTISGSKFEQKKYKPLIDTDFKISDLCCNVMKKAPLYEFEKRTDKKPIIGIMTNESMLREKNWLKFGCNAFESNHPKSAPLSFWTEQDILQYIKENEIAIASVYGDIEYKTDPEQMRIEEIGVDCGGYDTLKTTGCNRTGCIFCGFGCHLDKEPSRFQMLKQTHPRQYEYCIGGGEYVGGVWQPNKQGLGMGHVFDELNKIYGDGFIKY